MTPNSTGLAYPVYDVQARVIRQSGQEIYGFI
jgi:hypothetical protein